MSRLFILLAVFFISLEGRAQIQGFELERPIIESSIDQWTANEGLVSNNLTHVLQSKSGFLWISSYNGMMRFDGQRFELFNRSVMPFLSSEAFYRIYEGKAGELWMPSQGSGIVRYTNGEFRSLLADNKLLPRSIRCLAFSPDGTVFAGSNNKGLYRIKENEVERVEFEPLTNVSVNSLAYDQQGRLWIGTNGKGLVCLFNNQIKQFTINDGLVSNVINVILAGPQGEMIVGTSIGLNIIKDDRLRTVDFFHGQQINDLQIDMTGALWAATSTGLGRLNLVSGKYEFLSRKQGLPSLEITGLNFDKEGSLWLTTSKGGLVRLKKSTIISYTTLHGLSTDEVNVITQDQSGKLYIGSDGGDIDILENKEVHSLALKTNLKNVGIRDVVTDHEGVLWISSYRGILQKKGDVERLLTIKDGLPAEDVRRIFQDRQNNLWFGSRSGGLMKFKNDKVVATYDRTNGLESNYILSIEEDPDGTIYAGTNGGGLARITPDGKLTTLHLSSDDGGMLIFNIQIDNHQSIWLTTNQGIFHYDGQQFKKIVLEVKTTPGTIFDWQEDDYAGVWLSTNKGILYFQKEAARQFLNGRISAIPVQHFDDQDGMKNRECTSATRILKSQDGDLWIPTLGGVARIDPRKILRNDQIPPAFITHIITDKKDTLLTANTEPVIPPGNLRYVFQFTALSFIAPKKVYFKYQLEGVDENWVEAGALREAQYTNLPPGRYTFKVIACNNDGLWNEKGSQITLTIKPYFYQTIPFFISVVVLLVILLFVLYKWRLRLLENRNLELKKLNSELDKFVYSASHDLRAPLSSILGLVNVARQEPPTNKDFYLNLIEKSIHKLDQFIRDIIDFSRNARLDLVKEEINFEQLIQGVVDEMKYMDENNRILRTIKVIGQGPFYSDSRRLTIILNNLVSNAIKYHNPMTDSPYIEIRVELDHQGVKINVSDNGHGIGPEHIGNIFKMFYRATEASKGSGLGLYIVHETVEKLSGQVSVKSTLGVGSTFEVWLPSLR